MGSRDGKGITLRIPLELLATLEEGEPGTTYILKADGANQEECSDILEAVSEVLPDGVQCLVTTLDLEVERRSVDELHAIWVQIGEILSESGPSEDDGAD